MDGGVIFWLIVIGLFVVWPIIKSNRQQKKVGEIASSIPDLTIKVEIEKVKEIQCFVVYAKGWINSKREHSVSGNISLSLIDKTEDPGSLVLTSAEGFGEISYPHIFNQSKEMELSPSSYFPDYVKLFVVPVDVLAFPHKGNRNIEAK